LNATFFAPILASSGGDSVDASVAVIAILVIFGGPIFGWVVVSWLRPKERMQAQLERIEMIRHGMVPPGATFGAPGYGPAPEYRVSGVAGVPDAARAQLYKGIKTAAVGLALFIGLSFIDPFHPGPWLLGGLVPLFVGLAQILTAYLSGATLGNAAWRPADTMPPPPPQPGAPPGAEPPGASPPGGPYTYRPSGTSPELRPPTPPPEKR
jgi:hypothetical protein